MTQDTGGWPAGGGRGERPRPPRALGIPASWSSDTRTAGVCSSLSPRAERPTPPRPTDRSEEDTVTRQALTAVEQDFHDRMHAAQMYGLWELASQMTRHPEPKAIPHMWKSSLIEAMVRESGEVVPVGEERRARHLFNPRLRWRGGSTNKLSAPASLPLGGVGAHPHPHTPSALRFIMWGATALTAL